MYVKGSGQPPNDAMSSEQVSRAPVRLEENVNRALRSLLSSSGVEVIDVSGSTVSGGSSTVHSKLAGGSSRCPKRLMVWTSNVWLPSAASGTWYGELHGVNSAPSNEHV